MNRSKIRVFTVLFLTVAILDIIGIVTGNSLLRLVFKPLIILMLVGLYFNSVEKVNKWYLFALLFSFLGDVLLLDKFNYFIFGIAAFLITQALYIKIIIVQLKRSTTSQKILVVIPFLLFFGALLYVLKDNLNDLFYPVAFYGITISIFGMTALLNYLVDKESQAAKLLLIGALVFIASDCMIALHKFKEPKMFYPVAIMVTYVLAQYLIYKFMIKLEGKNCNTD